MEDLELIIDKEDIYLETPNTFYLNSNRLSYAQYLNDKIFSSCTIRNTNVDIMSSLNFSHLLKKLKTGGNVEVIVFQPISVMQEFDAKQIEANAKLAGFDEFETKKEELVDGQTNKKIKTLVVKFVKPNKNKDEIELEVVVTKKEDRNKQTKGNVTTTTTTTITNKSNPGQPSVVYSKTKK